MRMEFEFKRDCTRQLVMYLWSSDNTHGREFGWLIITSGSWCHMCDRLNTVGLNIYRASEGLEELTWKCRKGSECFCDYQKYGGKWCLFLLKKSQNEFYDLGKKSLHRYHWELWLDCLWIIFSLKVNEYVILAQRLFI